MRVRSATLPLFAVAAALITSCSPRSPALSWGVIGHTFVSAEFADSIVVSTIEVTAPSFRDTIRNVLAPMPLLIGDSAIVGIAWDTTTASRQFFRVAKENHRVEFLKAPGDLSPYFADVSIGPDGRYLLYLGVDPVAYERVIVRRWPNGAVVVRSPSTPSCDCDGDLHHAHWVSADSFEFATQIDAIRWERIAGSVSSGRLQVDTVRGEPDWHRAP